VTTAPRHRAPAEPLVFGPYQSAAETRTGPLLQEWTGLHDAHLVATGDPQGVARGLAVRHLNEACRLTGVELGAYDVQVVASLSRSDIGAIQAVIGWLSRAYAAGWAAGRARGPAEPGEPAGDQLGDGAGH
jgi:hypothetical protein